MAKRKKCLENFITGNIKILILSLKSNGAGLDLNLTKHIVFMESNCNLQTLIQSVGRAVRIGNPHPIVFIHHLFYKDSIEENDLFLE